MLRAKLILERLDKDYRLLKRKEQQSRSFTKSFIQLLYVAHAQIQNSDPYTMKDITNIDRGVDGQSENTNIRRSKANLRISAPGGGTGLWCSIGRGDGGATWPLQTILESEKVGIVVGTGTNTVTPTDVALQTKIVHGRAAGQLEYGGCELLNIVFVNPNGEFTIRRYFTNASGSSITVNEVGIYAPGTDYGDHWAWSFLIARDLVSPGVAVADAEILRVTYVLQITV